MDVKVDARNDAKADGRAEVRSETPRLDVKREFLIERHGRVFVLYAGLLDLAHRQGLKAIRTRLLQVPSDDNGQLAVCAAEVETDRGVFSGIGDASPSNVSRQMVHHTIRLAETRAKARALRDAVNVGVVAFEELGDEDEDRSSSFTSDGDADGGTVGRTIAEAPLPPVRTVKSPPASSAGGGPATPAQVRAIYLIGRDQHGLSEAELEQRSVALYGAPPAELTKKQASDLITALKG